MKTATIDSMAAKVRQQAQLIDILGMWAEVEAQGIDPETVKSFTFRDEFLTFEQKNIRKRATRFGGADPYTDGPKVKMYNCVRLKDDSFRPLNPMIRHREPA